MTHDEKTEIDNGMISGIRMLLQKAQEVGRIKSTWTITEMEQMSDILKNISDVYENYASANYHMIEHGTESF